MVFKLLNITTFLRDNQTICEFRVFLFDRILRTLFFLIRTALFTRMLIGFMVKSLSLCLRKILLISIFYTFITIILYFYFVIVDLNVIK